MELLQVGNDYSVCHRCVCGTRRYLLRQIKFFFVRVKDVVQWHKQTANVKKINQNTKNLAKMSGFEVVCPFRNHMVTQFCTIHNYHIKKT